MYSKYQVKKILQETKNLFSKAQIDSFHIDSEILLCEVLNITREKLCIYDDGMSQAQYDLLQSMIQQRLQNIPISYIINKKSFWDFEFYVDCNTLIPRPETEILIETLLKHNTYIQPKILDLGTGCGCIIITLSKILALQQAYAVDISEQALKVAQQNAIKFNCNIQFIQSNWFEHVNNKFNIIVSNPPYIENLSTLSSNVLYEPHIALYGGKNGMDEYYKILLRAKDYLSCNGLLILEFGYNQKSAIIDLSTTLGYIINDVVNDLAGIPRVIVLSFKE